MAQRKTSSPFSTAPSQDVFVAGATPTTIQKSPAEFTNPVQSAIPGIQAGINLQVDSFKRDLSESTQRGFEPEVAAIKAAAFQTDVGNKIGELSEEDLRSSLIQQLGGSVDDPRITEAVGFFNKLADAEAKGKSIRGHTQTLALKEMKRMIAANPLFEDEIRGAATKALGFDPTGKDVTAALATFDKKAQAPKLTEFEKSVENLVSTGLFATREDAILAAQQSVINDQTQVNLLTKANIKALNQDEFTELSRVSSSKIMDNAILKVRQLSANPETAGQAFALARSDIEQQFNSAIASFNQISAGVVPTEVMKEELANFENIKKQALEMFDNGSMEKVLQADNKLLQQISLNKAFGIPGVVEAHTLFGDKFLDSMSWASSMANNPNFNRLQTQLDPLAGTAYDLTSLLLGMNNAHKRVQLQQGAANQQEVLESANAVSAVVTGKETSDAEKANYVNGAAKVMPVSTLLKQFDTDQHKLSVLENPQLRTQFESIYSTERESAETIITESLAAIVETQTKGFAPEIFVTEDGSLGLALDRSIVSQTSPGTIGQLREGVRRMNNIINLTNRYGGTVLKNEPNLAEEFVIGSTPTKKAEAVGAEPGETIFKEIEKL
jgi:hypothetical protein